VVLEGLWEVPDEVDVLEGDDDPLTEDEIVLDVGEAVPLDVEKKDLVDVVVKGGRI